MPLPTDAQVQVAGEAFLDEAYVFYVLLASKIQRVYGSVGLVQSLGPEDEALVELAGAPRGEHSASPHADVEAAVCHCHVAMGDLLRYWAGAGFPQGAGAGSAATPPWVVACCQRAAPPFTGVCRYKSTMRTAGEVDWEAIERAYQTAASIHAASGAPFNQLAVLATCRPAPRDPLGAMYNYLRWVRQLAGDTAHLRGPPPRYAHGGPHRCGRRCALRRCLSGETFFGEEETLPTPLAFVNVQGNGCNQTLPSVASQSGVPAETAEEGD